MKARFQGGSIAYVFADELPLFASVYSKDRRKLSYDEFEILELLHREGPMGVKNIKELTGLMAKQITPVLHRLQQRFLVFEDQADDEWDRAWYPFETEFPDMDLEEYNKDQTIKTLVMRFAYLNVFINTRMLNSFYRLPRIEFQKAVSELLTENKLVHVTIDQEPGYLRTGDLPLLEDESHPRKSVFALHRNDFLVKSNEYHLFSIFAGDKYNVRHRNDKPYIMHFILIDGEFRGFTAGYFRIRPDIIEDVVLDLDESGKNSRKQEILEAVKMVSDPDESPVKRYCGEKLQQAE